MFWIFKRTQPNRNQANDYYSNNSPHTGVGICVVASGMRSDTDLEAERPHCWNWNNGSHKEGTAIAKARQKNCDTNSLQALTRLFLKQIPLFM